MAMAARLAMTQAAEHERRAEAHHDDADVFHAVIGQQAFQVMFLKRVQNAHYRGDHAHGKNHGSGPQRGRPVEVEEHARHAVDAGLDHNSRHQRRDIAGRHRVGVRQPDVERHDAGLHAEAGEEQQEHRALRARRKLGREQMEAAKIRAAGEGGQQQECRENHGAAGVRHDQVHHRRAPGFGLLVFERHQAKGGERHHFPGGQEEERVARCEYQGEAQQQDVIEKGERSYVARALHGAQIPERVHRCRQRQQCERERKPGRQRIEPHRAGEERHQRQIPGGRVGVQQGAESGHRQQHAAHHGEAEWHNPGGGGALPGGQPCDGACQERNQRGSEEEVGQAHQSCASRFISPIICMAWLRFVWQYRRMVSSTSLSTGFARE